LEIGSVRRGTLALGLLAVEVPEKLSMTAWSTMEAMIRISPWQFGQTSGSPS